MLHIVTVSVMNKENHISNHFIFNISNAVVIFTVISTIAQPTTISCLVELQTVFTLE